MRPTRKRFGQHFLERAWADKLTAAIAPQADETFLEIGPGRGALTIPLAARAKHVIGFEIDRDLARDLRASHHANVTIIEGDFLTLSADDVKCALGDAGAMVRLKPDTTKVRLKPDTTYGPEVAETTVRVAGNLPYNVASPILSRLVELFEAGIPFADATVMLQREVADRLTASPGTKEYGVLSILIGRAASVERLLALPPGAFRPAPAVRSAVVRLRFHPPDPAPRDAAVFHAMVHAMFSRRRKTLANALQGFLRNEALSPAKALTEAGLDGRKRPENLTIAELVRLSDAFSDASRRETAKHEV